MKLNMIAVLLLAASVTLGACRGRTSGSDGSFVSASSPGSGECTEEDAQSCATSYSDCFSSVDLMSSGAADDTAECVDDVCECLSSAACATSGYDCTADGASVGTDPGDVAAPTCTESNASDCADDYMSCLNGLDPYSPSYATEAEQCVDNVCGCLETSGCDLSGFEC